MRAASVPIERKWTRSGEGAVFPAVTSYVLARPVYPRCHRASPRSLLVITLSSHWASFWHSLLVANRSFWSLAPVLSDHRWGSSFPPRTRPTFLLVAEILSGAGHVSGADFHRRIQCHADCGGLTTPFG